MITTLITDLAHDKIPMAQGLTRTKIVQSKLKVEELKTWLSNELNGYDKKEDAPGYRKLHVSVVGHFIGPFGQQVKNAPLDLTSLGKDLDIDFYEYVCLLSIKAIEEFVSEAQGDNALMHPFPQRMVTTLANMYRRNDPDQNLVSAGTIVTPNQLRNILHQTKQRLLDILLDLHERFPEMDDDFLPSKENREAARNIVTNHIYGSTNTNIAVGDSVVQSGLSQVNKTNIDRFSDQLKKANVPDEDISEIKVIVASNESRESKNCLRQ